MKIVRLRGRWREELPATVWRWLLLPAWLVFRPLVWLRNLMFDLGWRRPVRLIRPIRTIANVGFNPPLLPPVPVWSVGNLTAGGTGKTPLTRYLARWAINHELCPAIISRGYRAEPGASNDEARLVSECPVICASDRIAGGRRAIVDGATCLILDDGFQHRRLHRDLDAVLIDATRPWGFESGRAGATLPLGYLRENRAALRRATVLVLTRGALVPPQQLANLQRELAQYALPIIHVEDRHARLRALAGTTTGAVADLIGRAVMLVSGVGNPLGFERSAHAHGWQVCASLRYPDHHHYDADDVATIIARAQQHDAVVVMTGKDAVKLVALVPAAEATRMQVLEVDSVIRDDDQAILDQLLLATLTPR